MAVRSVVFALAMTMTGLVARADDPMLTTLTGKVVEYEIAGYHLRVEFQAEDKLRWEYLAAPNGLTGKSAVESVDRRDIRPGVVLMAWTEADGSNVVDVFDFDEKVLHANFVMPDGQRFQSAAELKIVK